MFFFENKKLRLSKFWMGDKIRKPVCEHTGTKISN